MATDGRLIKSAEVGSLAKRSYPQAGQISAQAASDADILFLSAVSTDPANTAKTVSAYMAAFIEYRRTTALDDVLAAHEVLARRPEQFQQQLNAPHANAVKPPAIHRVH